MRKYIPQTLIEIWREFHQKRFEIAMGVPTVSEVLTVGDFTYGTEHLEVLFRDTGAKVEIGKFCSIARGVRIILGGPFNQLPRLKISMQLNRYIYLVKIQ